MGNFYRSMGNWNSVTENFRSFAGLKFLRYGIKPIPMGNFGLSMGNWKVIIVSPLT
jgi:hypothetical protein